MIANYYDPMFYLCSDELQFVICIKVYLTDSVDGDALRTATNQVIKRFPYFSVKVIEKDGELLTVPNDKPVVVYRDDCVYPLGGEEVNGHVAAFSYDDNCINFYMTHVITDGAGYFPFVKSVLYHYLNIRYDTVLDPDGIRSVDCPYYPDELGNPFPEKDMEIAVPFGIRKSGNCFKLSDGGYVNDSKLTVYRLKISEKQVMAFNYDNDGSPCSLLSSIMAKAIWSVHPDINEDIVSAVSFNLRPGLGNSHSYRMLCSTIRLAYPKRLQNAEISYLCTCSRGMTSIQSQRENVLYIAQQRKKLIESLDKYPDVAGKKAMLSKAALYDSLDNTFSVSYVGKIPLGSIAPYVEKIYNITDGSTQNTVFIEVSVVNGVFNIAFIQGFSNDIYYRAFLKQLDICGLDYTEDGHPEIVLPKMKLPE